MGAVSTRMWRWREIWCDEIATPPGGILGGVMMARITKSGSRRDTGMPREAGRLVHPVTEGRIAGWQRLAREDLRAG